METFCTGTSTDTVYYSALRFIAGDSSNTHHCGLYAKAGWPSPSKRPDKHWLVFIIKALTGPLPLY